MSSLYWKLIGGAVAAVLIGVFVASWMARGREIVRLADWQSTVTLAVTSATVEPDKNGKRARLKPDQVPAAVAALRLSLDHASATLAEIDRTSLKDKAISDKLDEQLASILAGQDKASAGSAATIRDLMNRKSTGDRDLDCAVMETDSGTPWTGWSN